MAMQEIMISCLDLNTARAHGYKQSWKLCLNLCSFRWVRPNLNLVRYFIPTGSCILKIEFCIVLPIFNNEFRNIKKKLSIA